MKYNEYYHIKNKMTSVLSATEDTLLQNTTSIFAQLTVRVNTLWGKKDKKYTSLLFDIL
jgi:hypothetical protein